MFKPKDINWLNGYKNKTHIHICYLQQTLLGRVLGSITRNRANGGDGIPTELFQILKDDGVKSAVLYMPTNLENSAVATGLQRVNFHSNPEEEQCQRMFKLLHNCINFTCQQSKAQNSPSQASVVCVLRTSRCSSWIQKRQKNQRSNCQHLLDKLKSRRSPEKHLLLLH